MSSVLISRLIGAVIFGLGGWRLALYIPNPPIRGEWGELLFIICGAGIGFVLTPYLTIHPRNWIRGRIKQIPNHTFLAAITGLASALVISAILALPLSLLPGIWGKILPAVISLILCYLGVSIMTLRSRDIAPLFGSMPSMMSRQWNGRDEKVILDTSSIIDGRIADITQTGFLHGTLVIPKFVLDELRHIADSSDQLRRNRGRRGLNMLAKLQKESDIPVQISDMDFKGIREVDAKLVELAKTLHCPIVTNDVNLNRVAELQGIRVLNINELASALKPVVMPGEEMKLRIVQEGKEPGQGVGFLDDGTMVVVEGGRRYLNNEINIVVNRVLQTGAGRMIFAQPRP